MKRVIKARMWKVKIEEVPTILDRKLVEEMEKFLNQEWKPVVLEEVTHPWWGPKYMGVPSPVIRVDMAPMLKPGGAIEVKSSIYEVEARPGGLGLMLSLVPKGRIKQWKRVFSGCQGFIVFQSSIQDDELAAKILGIPYYEEIPQKPFKGPYWVRSNERCGEITELEDVSLVPVRLDGDKSYLVRLGLAEMLTLERLDWNKPFVVKPLRGARMEGVEIYLPPSLKKKLGDPDGTSTKGRILRTISKEAYILQRFIPPKEEEKNGLRGWTIWRPFFGWMRERKKYEFLGGLWNWRPNLRIHGAVDSIFGALLKA